MKAVPTKLWHPGIRNEYVFGTWDEAREYLEQHHGGLASGMLANLVEIELTDLAERLDAAGVEDRGREWNDTYLRESRNGSSNVLRVDPDNLREPNVHKQVSRVLRLSDRKWAKWYYRDPVGNASLLCWAEWGPS